MEAALEKALANPGLGLLLLDETNRGLAEDVEQLRQEVDRSEDTWKLESDAKRRTAENVSDMMQMLDNIQKLVSTHQKDIDGESQQEKVASSEAEGIVRQCRKKHNEIAHFQEASDHLESLATHHQKELQDLQKNVDGDSSLLKELLDHLAEADNDNLLLLQYSAEDASKIKELSVALERASEEVAATEAELSSAQAETAASQTTLDQLGTAFLQAAAHRDDLLAQWELTLNHIYQKANEHTLCIEDSIATQQKIDILRREVDQEMQILKQVQSSCQQVLADVRVVEDESVVVNTQYQTVCSTRDQIQAQIWALQNALSKVNKDIEGLTVQLSEQRSFREEKQAFQATMEQRCKKSEEKLTVNTELVMSVEETLQSLEAMLRDAEGLAKGLNRQKERIKDAEMHHERAVKEWKHQEATVKGETTALTATKQRNLSYIKELDGRALKQKEVLHDQELNLQQLRRRLHELTHDSNNNAVDVEGQKLVEVLQLRLQETMVSIRMLTKQLTMLKNTRTQEKTSVSQLQKRVSNLEAELTTVKMSSESAERECAKLNSKCEELIVDVSLSQLHLQRRMAKLQAVMGKAAKLAEDKTGMEELVGEQISDVKARVDQADSTVRALTSEMHTLSLKLHQVSSRITHLKDKHAKIKLSLDSPEGEEVSTTQVFLKVANERAGLQETGDLLDLEVRRAEEEVEALQQMLTLITIEGQQYRSQLHDIIHHSEEEKERVMLEENLATLEDEIQEWEHVLEEAHLGLQNTQGRLHEVELQVHAVEELLREKNIHMTAVQRETESHSNKAIHAAQATTTMQWRTRGKAVQQQDIELRLGQERLRVVNTLLGDAVSHHPEASDAVVIYCQQVNVPPPEVTKLTKKESYGSRSSLGTLHSSRSSSSSHMRSPSPRLDSQRSRSHHSSMTSLRSQDSGRSGSPPLQRSDSRGRRLSKIGVKPSTHPGITVMAPDFPSKNIKRQQYQGKKLSKRPTMHM